MRRIIRYMGRIASSENEKELDENIKSLYGSHVWNTKNSNKFRIYFESTWLPIKKVVYLYFIILICCFIVPEFFFVHFVRTYHIAYNLGTVSNYRSSFGTNWNELRRSIFPIYI